MVQLFSEEKELYSQVLCHRLQLILQMVQLSYVNDRNKQKLHDLMMDVWIDI